MEHADPDDVRLIERARRGDGTARQELLGRHRDRLRRMVTVRLDPRISARVDPSDVVQEALVEAAALLPSYLEKQPIPFYLWLRRLAWERLVKLHRRHIGTKKRTVAREVALELPDGSVAVLAQVIVAGGTGPSERAVREELRDRVRAALRQLRERDREVLTLRYLEQLSTAEIAAVAGCTPGTVTVRHLRALERLRALLGEGAA